MSGALDVFEENVTEEMPDAPVAMAGPEPLAIKLNVILFAKLAPPKTSVRPAILEDVY